MNSVRPRFVAYFRVSTGKQRNSGLGQAAQEEAVAAYIHSHGGYVSATFTETESGRKSDRPQLRAALLHASRLNATLIIAKLDRLTRNTRFLLSLVEAGVDLAFCDFPQIPTGPMGKFFLTMLVAVAEFEAGLASQRTKAALKAFKAGRVVPKRIRDMYPNGVPSDVVEATAGKLGADLPQCRNLTPEVRKKASQAGNDAIFRLAMESALFLAPRVREMRRDGKTYQAIADQFNEDGLTTRRQKPWSATAVFRMEKQNPPEEFPAKAPRAR